MNRAFRPFTLVCSLALILSAMSLALGQAANQQVSSAIRSVPHFGDGGPVTAAVPQQAGSHGYLASDPDLDAIFIASGYGVKPRPKLDKVSCTDLAPTIARLLGVELPSAKAKALALD